MSQPLGSNQILDPEEVTVQKVREILTGSGFPTSVDGGRTVAVDVKGLPLHVSVIEHLAQLKLWAVALVAEHATEPELLRAVNLLNAQGSFVRASLFYRDGAPERIAFDSEVMYIAGLTPTNLLVSFYLFGSTLGALLKDEAGVRRLLAPPSVRPLPAAS